MVERSETINLAIYREVLLRINYLREFHLYFIS